MSARKAEVNKNKILDWLKDNFSLTEIDVSQMPEVAWSISIGGGIAIYTINKNPDKVITQSDILFSEEQQDLLNNQWEKSKLSKLQLNITSSLTNFNVRYEFLLNKDKKIRGVRIHLFLIDNLNKETLLYSVFRIGEVLTVTLNQLSSVIGVELQQLQDQQDVSSFNPLAT